MYRRAKPRLSLALALLAVVACGASSGEDVRVVGDTVAIRSRGPGLWGTLRAREVGRVLGPARGIGFGQVTCLAVGLNGDVAVFDRLSSMAEDIQLFDSSGRLMRVVGREGAGPGEYSPRVTGDCLEFASDSSLVLLDSGNGRLVRYSKDGVSRQTLSGVVAAGGRTPYLTPGRDGEVYFPVRTIQPDGARSDAWLPGTFARADPVSGRVDTLPPLPDILGRAPVEEMDPVSFAIPIPDSRILLFRTDRLGFTSIDLHDAAVRVVEREYDAQRLTRGELADRDRLWDWYRKVFPEPPQDPGIADVKPAFYSAEVDHSGRVWLMRAVAADSGTPIPRPGAVGASNPPPPVTWSEETVFAVFRWDGTYLGEVKFAVPNLLWLGGFSQSGAWTAAIDSTGTPVLVRWAFDTAGGPSATF